MLILDQRKPVIAARKQSLGQGNIFAPVCHSVPRREEYLGTCPLPGQGTPPGPGTPPGTRYTPQDQVQPPPLGPGTHTPRPGTPPRDQVHPPRPGTPPGLGTTPQAVHAGRYGQQAGGTHPTGMHSC